MTIDKAAGWLALIAILGGISRIGMTPSSYIWGGDSDQELICAFIANILMVIGTFGIYLKQIKESGKFGFISFLILELGLILVTCTVWSSMLHVDPWEWGIVKTMEITTGMLGLILFPIAGLKARVLPKWPCILMIAMLFVGPIPMLEKWVALLWGLSYIGMGYAVWSTRNRSSHSWH
ncbi:hypothetical protein SAMN02799630_00128 [Paenibacillus sp. UNCCL117]|uniref:hypothetical protein n=1 Tax=unclassified Paenibacillus TaxID=185978 RepID=UPI00087E59A5|nr:MULTISPECIES: hypothetical protein [unclassified Paenibacillus]SDC51678.1 hypothetical protein SAMN04488602_102404 [Paenibacillus sp. cl123]SFW11423.1 hypothetical protein SAMN02799630_00128 [Paenibacillus sp. UNCCL117]